MNALNVVWSDIYILQQLTEILQGKKNFPSKLEIFTKLKIKKVSLRVNINVVTI